MKKACFALASVMAIANEVGAIDVDPEFVRGRNLVQTSRGLWIENHYIAHVSGEEHCAETTEKITTWKKQLGVAGGFLRTADDGSDDAVNALQIEADCFIPFVGPVDLVEKVRKLDGVIRVEEDFVVQGIADPASWGLNRIDQPDLPLSSGVDFNPPYSGKGVNVYVIDTGVRPDHTQFAIAGGSRASMVWSAFINPYTDPAQLASLTDGNGHGTHVAGTVGGSTFGIAREANILGVQVLSAGGSGSTSGVIAGMHWVVTNQKEKFNGEPAVLSMSLGGSSSSTMNDAARTVNAAGHIVVVAAGNEDTDACTKSPAGAGGSGRSGGVISVGATTSSDRRASFSNYGSCVDIFAPGQSITSSWKDSPTSTNTISGTSMATPHVSGVAASLLQKHNMNKDAAQAELFSLAVGGKITDTKNEDSNLLLQIPTYTGPPTPATPKPTMPPTLAPPALCVGDSCFKFEVSQFGPEFPNDSLVYGPIVLADDFLCSATKQDFTGAIVVINRGGCLFFDKVKNAELGGAVAAIIANNDPLSIFPPAYFGSDSTDIPSLMISMTDGATLAGLEGERIWFGSPSLTLPPPSPTASPIPTPEPTIAPSFTPTQAPTLDIVSPNCGASKYDLAEKKCTDMGLHVCSIDFLKTAPNDSKCNLHNKYVWTNSRCYKNRKVNVYNRRLKKAVCVWPTKSFSVRCCINP